MGKLSFIVINLIASYLINLSITLWGGDSIVSQKPFPCHPKGDIYPCSHPAHPAGDVIPCGHVCYGPYGAYTCHPNGDIIPCSHPVHYVGDVAPCVHTCW